MTVALALLAILVFFWSIGWFIASTPEERNKTKFWDLVALAGTEEDRRLRKIEAEFAVNCPKCQELGRLPKEQQ